MTVTEIDVCWAAVELSRWRQALDCGCPAQKLVADAERRLFELVEALENENDGRWEPPLSEGTKTYRNAIRKAMEC